MATPESLKGKVAVVTGASNGIGKAIAEALARAGASVSLAARTEAKLEEVQKRIEEGGGKTIIVRTDVTERQEVKDLIRRTEEQLGPVDILVNNAGVGYITFMRNLKEDSWDRTVNVNCKGVLNGIGAVLPGMIERKRGHIINISSNAGKVAFPGLAVYTGTKFFVEGVSRSLRMEVKDQGIKVTCIQPGDVETGFAGEIIDKESFDEYCNMFGSDPSKFLRPEDIGNAVVFAASQPDGVGINEVLVEPRAYPYV